MNSAVTSSAPIGKRCTRCLCCDAVIVFDGEALCAACDDGTHAPIHFTAEYKFPSPENQPQPVTRIEPIEEESMPESHKRKRGEPVPESIRLQIAAEDEHISNCALGRKYGISGVTVGYIRRAGKHNLAPSTAQTHTTVISLNITEDVLDNWWKKLDLTNKASIFTANYRFPIEGFIS